MIATEAEAAELWCPHHPSLHRDAVCMGSKCMMWRWLRGPSQRWYAAQDRAAVEEPARPDHLPPSWEWHPADEDRKAQWREPLAEAEKRRLGYCGLAGVP